MKFRLFLFAAFLSMLIAAGALAVSLGQNKGEGGLAVLSVRNLTCASCAGNIEKALADLPGIGATQVNIGERRVRVEYDPAQVNAGNIAEAVSAAGYPAALVPATSGAPAPAGTPARGCGGNCCNKP